MTARSVSIAIAGSGGAGVITAGTLLLEAAGRAGWYAYMTRSSGPQIRGGEAAAMIRLSTDPVASHDDHFHALVAIDWNNVGRFAAELPLSRDSLVIADPQEGEAPPQIRESGATPVALAMKELAKAIPGGRPNMVAMGAVAALIGLPEEPILEMLRKVLKRKGEKRCKQALPLRAGMNATKLSGDTEAAAARPIRAPAEVLPATSGRSRRSAQGVRSSRPIRLLPPLKCWSGWRRHWPRWAAPW